MKANPRDMKREGLSKKRGTTHSHDKCGVCQGVFKSKAFVRLNVKKEIQQELKDFPLSDTKHEPK